MESGSAAVEKFESHNLRDFLRIKEEDHHSRINQRIAANSSVIGRGSISGVTLGAVLSDRNTPLRPADGPLPRALPNRTLLDIIRDDRTAQRRDRMSWLQLKEKLRLRRGAAGGSSSWASTTFPIPTSAMPINTSSSSTGSNPAILRRNPSPFSHTTEPSTQSIVSTPSSLETVPVNRPADRTDGRFERVNTPATTLSERETNGNDHSSEEVEEDGDQYEPQPARMSLMALLEETDRQLGYDVPSYTAEHEEVVASAAADMDGDSGGGMQNTCCVCMVRQKGAAFIPCGHTFCRLCCRELLSHRGNCPLCNNHILEILDIF